MVERRKKKVIKINIFLLYFKKKHFFHRNFLILPGFVFVHIFSWAHVLHGDYCKVPSGWGVCEVILIWGKKNKDVRFSKRDNFSGHFFLEKNIFGGKQKSPLFPYTRTFCFCWKKIFPIFFGHFAGRRGQLSVILYTKNSNKKSFSPKQKNIRKKMEKIFFWFFFLRQVVFLFYLVPYK